MKPVLSIVISGRNDNYMGNSNWRMETTINFLAKAACKVNQLSNIELIIVDWRSRVPLYQVLNLTEQARQITKFIVVPISYNINGDSDFPSSVAANVGIRRALGDFTALSTADLVFTENFLKKLFNILSGKYEIGKPVDKSLLQFNRKSIPLEISNQELSLFEIDKYIIKNGKQLPVEPLVPYYLAPSSIQLMHRDLWYESHSFDEGLIHPGWSDIDLCLRMRLKYSVVDMSKEEDMYLYHLDHYTPGFVRRKINPLVINPFVVNDENWGLADQEFEEFPKKPTFNPQCRNEMEKVVTLPDLNFRRKHLLCLIKFLIRNLSFGNLKFATSHSILIFEQYPDKSILRVMSGYLKLLRNIYRLFKKKTK